MTVSVVMVMVQMRFVFTLDAAAMHALETAQGDLVGRGIQGRRRRALAQSWTIFYCLCKDNTRADGTGSCSRDMTRVAGVLRDVAMDNGRLAVVAVDGRFALDRLALGGRGMGTRRRGARGGTRGPAPGGHRGSRLCDGRGRRGLQALVRVVQHGRGILGGVHCASSCSAMGERGAAPAQAGSPRELDGGSRREGGRRGCSQARRD
jgi:hypothetical protein